VPHSYPNPNTPEPPTGLLLGCCFFAGQATPYSLQYKSQYSSQYTCFSVQP
jgi:hypothetical protein